MICHDMVKPTSTRPISFSKSIPEFMGRGFENMMCFKDLMSSTDIVAHNHDQQFPSDRREDRPCDTKSHDCDMSVKVWSGRAEGS